jgi:hypothetical protein
MIGALLVNLNSPLILANLSPTPLKTGQVLVRVIASGICGSQLHEIRGDKGNAAFLPHLMGHEGFGEVMEVGLGVTHVKVSDRVVMHWRNGIGNESDFPNYVYNKKLISSGKVTTLSELSIVSANKLTKVPADTNPIFGALLGCAITTSFGVIENEAKLKLGESIAVIGCGGVGLGLIQASRLKGASQIYGIDINKEKESFVKLSGANKFISLLENLPNKVDIIVDTTGLTNLWTKALQKLNPTGRLILVGQPNPKTNWLIDEPFKLFQSEGFKIKISQGGSTNPTIDIPKYLNLFNQGKIDLNSLVTHEFSLDRINEAIDILTNGTCGRIIIKME